MNTPSDKNPLRKLPTRAVSPAAADIGAILREARVKKGQTIATVCQQTRISKKFLEALESNNLEEFPAVAYLRGFLKSYCDYLELDFDPLWKMAFPVAAPPPPASNEPAPQSKPKPAEPPASNPWLFPLIAVAVLCAAFMLIPRSNKPEPEAPKAENPPPALQPMESKSQAHLMLNFTKETWIRLSADGEVRFEGRVPQKTLQDWKAKKTFLLRVADPSALVLTLDNSSYTLTKPEPSGDYRIETP